MTAAPGRPVARKRFGQHFLADAAAIERILAALRPAAADAVIEIGPGTGALTAALAARAASLRAIEIDRDLAADLAARFPQADIVCADALDADFAAWLHPPPRIVGNLPYNVATPLLHRLLPLAGRVVDMHFLVQREVGERLTAAPGCKAYGRLTVSAGMHCRIERLFDIPAASFRPRPKVDGSFLRFAARKPGELEPCDADALGAVLRIAFGRRRKMLANALDSLGIDWTALGIDPRSRPETLGIRDFIAIANHAGCRRRVGGKS